MSAQLHVEPRSARVDQPLTITATGFAPGAHITVTAESQDPDHAIWRSEASFIADASGTIDLRRDASLRGNYTGIHAQGLIWSHTLQQAANGRAEGIHAISPIVTTLRVQDTTGVSADLRIERHFVDDGVTRREIREDGLVGTLYTPATPGPHPAIVYFNGSGGGINETRAALLAAHGYAALALGYFGVSGLPSHISNTPLEYFERGLKWVHAEVRPANGFVAVSGQSRGGELSLLLAATFPTLVSAVIAYVPSSVVHGVLAAGRPGENRYAPAWTQAGKPLTSIWDNNEQTDSWQAVDRSAEPRRQAQPFVDAHQNKDALRAARIPVERINGPVLLISGGDDGYWPSSDYAADVAQQLRAHSHAHKVVHLDYPGAGHSIQAPHVPATLIARAHAVSGVVLTAGGTPEANAQANEASWDASLTFLAEATAPRT